MKIGFLKTLYKWFKIFSVRVYDAFLRFPISIMCAVAIFIISDLHEHQEIFEDRIFYKLIFALSIGFVLFVAGELILEAHSAKHTKNRIAVGVAIYALVQGYYFLASGDNGRRVAQFAMIAAAASLFAIVALNIKNGKDFEKNVARILVRVASSFFFACVLLAGLCAILGSVDLLLVKIDTDWYAEMVRICYIIFLPVMFLMGLPEKDDDGAYPKALSALLSYVITPVIMIFTVVLYIYYIKLIATQSLPISEVGGVSLSFLAVCIPTLILITPFNNKLSNHIRKIIPFVLIPVVLVLFVAAGRQIAMYGITVTRYLVVIGGFAALISIVLIRLKEGRKQRFACFAVAVACVISAHGPQSAYNLTLYSQNKRFEGYLIQNNMLKDGAIVPNSDISEQDKKEIVGIVNYFRKNNLGNPKYVPDDISNLDNVFGFDFGYVNKDNSKINSKYYHAQSQPIEVFGYDYLFEEHNNTTSIQEKNIEVSSLADHENVTVRINGGIVCDITKQEIAQQIYNKVDTKKDEQSVDNLSYEYENEYIKLKLLFSDISFNLDNGNDLYLYGSCKTLLKVK